MEKDDRLILFHVHNNEDGSRVNIVEASVAADRLAELNLAKSQVGEFMASRNVVRSVIANRDDVLSSVGTIAQQYLAREESVQSILDQGTFNIARHIANMCSLFRSFVDHFDRYFVHAHGKESVEYRTWKSMLSEQYDHHLSYRLVYHMRNYIQHYDMPPISVSIHDKGGQDGVSIQVSFILSELMKDGFMRPKLRADDGVDQNAYSMFHVLDEWGDCFERVVEFANRIRIREAVPAAQKICNLRSELNLPERGYWP